SDMRRAINRFVIRVINSLDDVSLLAHSRVRKDGVSCGQIFQVRLEGTDVDRRTVRNILGNAKRVGHFLHSVESSELSNADAHGVARADKPVGARKNTAVSPIGISR